MLGAFMNSENGHVASSVLERAGVCQSSRCCGACARLRLGCARLFAENLTIAALETAASLADKIIPEAAPSTSKRSFHNPSLHHGLSGWSKVPLEAATGRNHCKENEVRKWQR
jgi:hypothetical protein